jgi:hypothetical protein
MRERSKVTRRSTGIGRDKETQFELLSLLHTIAHLKRMKCEASLMKHESSKQCHNSVCRVLSVSLSLSLSLSFPPPFPLRLGEKDLKGRLSFRGRRATTTAGPYPVLGAAACKARRLFPQFSTPSSDNFSSPRKSNTEPTFSQDTMPSTHKRDKPWDTEDIDKWKVLTSYLNSFSTADRDNRLMNSSPVTMPVALSQKNLPSLHCFPSIVNST